MKKILCYGFSHPIIDQVVPNLRKDGYSVTWIAEAGKYKDINPDYIADDIRHLSEHCVVRSKDGFRELYDKVYESLPRFLNINARERQYYRDETFFDALDNFNVYFNFYVNLIQKENVEAVILSYAPHSNDSFILYQIAKNLKLPIYYFVPCYHVGRTHYYRDIEDIGDLSKLPKLGKPSGINFGEGILPKIQSTPYQMNKYIHKNPMPKWLYNVKKTIKFEWSSIAVWGNAFRLYSINLETFSKAYLRYKARKMFLNNEKKYMQKNLDKGTRFVYFPLHLQPELATAMFGYDYFDQLLAIEELSHFIPKDWKIYVKDHPQEQTEYQRGDGFYKRLAAMPNVVLVDKKINGKTLIKTCEFVATITGTSGFEAICDGKKALYFGQTAYQSLPGVFLWKDRPSLKEIQALNINIEELKVQFESLFSYYGEGVLDQYYAIADKTFSVEKNQEDVTNLVRGLIKHLSS